MARIRLSAFLEQEGIAHEVNSKGQVILDSIDQDCLEQYVLDSTCPALCDEGCEVEPDGTCPHGCPSLLLVCGLM